MFSKKSQLILTKSETNAIINACYTQIEHLQGKVSENKNELLSLKKALKKLLALTFCFILFGCGKTEQSIPSGDGLLTATYTQENGFINVDVCNGYVHLVNGVAYVSGGNPMSETDNSNYTQATGGYFIFPNEPTGPCWYYIDENGGLDSYLSTISPGSYNSNHGPADMPMEPCTSSSIICN